MSCGTHLVDLTLTAAPCPVSFAEERDLLTTACIWNEDEHHRASHLVSYAHGTPSCADRRRDLEEETRATRIGGGRQSQRQTR